MPLTHESRPAAPPPVATGPRDELAPLATAVRRGDPKALRTFLLTMGMDLVHHAPVSTSQANVVLGSGETRGRPIAVAGVRAFAGAAPEVGLFAACSFAMVPTRYEFVLDGHPRTVGRVATLTPSLGVELQF